MNPGMVVKLRPAGPWRIGPDSGARNRVDAVYHSDTLYGAVTSAMAVLGMRDEWLDATARAPRAAVCFGSCFPFLDEIGYVAPPRTVWPPASPAATAGRVRWKSARFVPLGIVQAILAGQRLDDTQWTVDGASECLVPAGQHGPFRTGVRWNAAVDRLSGATERHSTACLEFRPGAGLWTVVSFADDAAHQRWADPVKAAFRWLADSGFGGERSRGWGRSESPEFVEGTLPGMLLGSAGPELVAEERSPAPPIEELPPAPTPVPEKPPEDEPSPVPPVEEPPAGEPPVNDPPAEEPASGENPAEAPEVEEPATNFVAAAETVAEPEPAQAEASVSEAPAIAALIETPASGPQAQAHWLLSLYTPAADDTVDWGRGSYTLMTRGGRVDVSGELKKQLPMVAEGSVLYASSELRGSAPDVAPDGYAHPVFRAGFAVAIPLPEAAQ
jgi:CRISPR type III-A-associated RAMP protein Csm4